MIFDRKPSAYDEAISRLEEELASINPDDRVTVIQRRDKDKEEIRTISKTQYICEQIEAVAQAKKESKWSLDVSAEVLVPVCITAITNVALTALILNYEQVNVLTSKAVRFIK